MNHFEGRSKGNTIIIIEYYYTLFPLHVNEVSGDI